MLLHSERFSLSNRVGHQTVTAAKNKKSKKKRITKLASLDISKTNPI